MKTKENESIHANYHTFTAAPLVPTTKQKQKQKKKEAIFSLTFYNLFFRVLFLFSNDERETKVIRRIRNTKLLTL